MPVKVSPSKNGRNLNKIVNMPMNTPEVVNKQKAQLSALVYEDTESKISSKQRNLQVRANLCKIYFRQ